MMLIYLFLSFCVFTLNDGKLLTLENARGKMTLKNFLHLHGHRLNVEPIASFDVGKEMICTANCVKSDECFSFNVKKLSSNKFLCELLNTSKYKDEDNLIKHDSFIHYYLQDPCVPNPCTGWPCKSGKKNEFTCYCFETIVTGKQCGPCKVPSQNFALGKTTQQSSTYSNGYGLYPASLAVDGNKKTNARNGDQPQCAHTNGGDRNWWRVDFGEKVPVARISITNRGDCCSHRQRDIEIRVGNSLVDDGLNNPKCGERHDASALFTTIMCKPIVAGRYLVIRSFLTESMNFCEVEVFCQ